MKKFNFCTGLLVIFFTSFYQTAYSQDAVFKGTGTRYSIGIDGGLALGHLKEQYGGNIGISAQADFPILENELYATVNTGFNNIYVNSKYAHLVDDRQLIPAKAGLKYFYSKNLYVQSEIGFSFLLNRAKCVEGKNAAFVYAPQAGMLFYFRKMDFIDVGLRFESNSKFYHCDGYNNFVSFRFAYGFTL